jgi:alpha,alpha-trehalase
MRRIFVTTALLFAVLAATSNRAGEKPDEYPEPPQSLFRELFAAVQTERLFADSKVFADAIPNAPPQRILEEYRAQRPASPEALRRFVDAHFSLPGEVTAASAAPGRESIASHIDGLWDALTRSTATAAPYSSLLPLPYPYVVPGGRFREMYYWDSYFTMLGLVESGRRDLATDMVRDFGYLIDTFGHVPNGTRTYYLSRSQPPLFFAMVSLLRTDDPPAAFAQYLPELRREYAFWMQGSNGLRPGGARRRVVALADGSILNRFWDERDSPRDESYREDTELARLSRREPRQLYRDIRAAAESGWDFGSRWFADGRTLATLDTTQIVPIDLNSLLFGLETAIAAGCRRRGEAPCTQQFERLAAVRRSAVDHYLWDEHSGAYLDYRWSRRERIARVSAATLYPLFVDLASKSQARSVARVVQRELLEAGGVAATAVETGQQWDLPNGWPPLQWLAVDGLRRYGETSLAALIACRWMADVNGVYRASGKLVEKYDVVTTGRSGGGGEYPSQDGFGWTNGVMRRLMALYPTESAYATAAECAEEGTRAATPNVKKKVAPAPTSPVAQIRPP